MFRNRIAATSLLLVFGTLFFALHAAAATQVTIEPGANQYCQDVTGNYIEDWNCDVGATSPRGEQYICLRGRYCVGYIPKQIYKIRGHCKLHLDCAVEEYFENGKWQPAEVPGKGIPATGPIFPTIQPADANVNSMTPLPYDSAYLRCAFGYGDCAASPAGGPSVNAWSSIIGELNHAAPAQPSSASTIAQPPVLTSSGNAVELQPQDTNEQILFPVPKGLSQPGTTFDWSAGPPPASPSESVPSWLDWRRVLSIHGLIVCLLIPSDCNAYRYIQNRPQPPQK